MANGQIDPVADTGVCGDGVGLRRPGAVLLVSCYELGRQPLGVAWPAGFLRRAGFHPRCRDVAVETLSRKDLQSAEVVVISVPMHTAMQLGRQVARLARDVNPDCRLVFQGLYAVLNATSLERSYDAVCLGGESESRLVEWLESLDRGEQCSGSDLVGLERQAFPVPDRSTLPPVETYAALEHRDENGQVVHATAGVVESSRGCRYLCTHCPIPPVYGGRFVAVPLDVVLADVGQQVDAGARHITFADPDFLNGPRHAARVAEALHARWPDVTFDFTAKIEHLVQRGDVLGDLVVCGATFVISAVESLSDHVLQVLDKGHSRADVENALQRCRDAGLPMRPTWVPFTPWASLDDYHDILRFVVERQLVRHIDPVQFSIRLLVPPGSLLEQHEEFLPHRQELDEENLSWGWVHPDDRMDHLAKEVAKIVERSAEKSQSPVETFREIADAAGCDLMDESLESLVDSRPAPRMTEDWFC